MPRAAPQPWEEAYRRQGRLWRGVRLDALTSSFLETHPEAADLRWFDAGCGDGKGLAALNARLQDGCLVGGDRAQWGLRVIRREVASAGSRLVRGDARSWPFPDGAFDVVRAVHFLGHLDASGRTTAMRELARLLAPNGTLLFGEFGSGDFRFGRGVATEPGSFRRGTGIVTHYFAPEELLELTQDAGLDVVSLEPERFTVGYGGSERPRERWTMVARRVHPGV